MDDDDIAMALRDRIAASAFHRGLGLEVLSAAPGRVRLAMPAREDQLNLLGSIHGGVLATLADIAMGLAVRTDAGEGRRHSTIDLDIRFLRSASPGTLTAEGTTVRVGSRSRWPRRGSRAWTASRWLAAAGPTTWDRDGLSSRRRACPSRRRAWRGSPASP